MFKNTHKKENGFTIIEVLIVLAIAGLIMLVVFLAVPSLQRNQRNSSRQADVSRVATGVNNWVANNNGKVFVAGVSNANLNAVKNDVGALDQYTLTPGTTFTVVVAGAAATLAPITTTTDIRVVTSAVCGDNGAAVADTNTRKSAVLYGAEGGTTNIGKCLNI